MPNVEAKLSYLDGMFNSQADLLEDTRSLLINSSILHIHQENQELKQSVRIADNELKIIMLIDQVRTFPMHKVFENHSKSLIQQKFITNAKNAHFGEFLKT